MLLTEAEVRTKVCPPSMGAAAGSRECHGSGCMAWRFDNGRLESEPRVGFCGLAGNPNQVLYVPLTAQVIP